MLKRLDAGERFRSIVRSLAVHHATIEVGPDGLTALLRVAVNSRASGPRRRAPYVLPAFGPPWSGSRSSAS
jgi:hypothetical protein